MKSSEIAINEYQALRAEVLALYSRRGNRLSVVWASISVLVASSAVAEIPELSCIAVFICCAGWNDEIKWYKGMMKIGSYIKCILEPQLSGLNWQKASRNSNYISKTNRSLNQVLNSYFITTLAVLSASGFLGLEYYPKECPRKIIYWILITLAIVVFVIVFVLEFKKQNDEGKYEDYFSKNIDKYKIEK